MGCFVVLDCWTKNSFTHLRNSREWLLTKIVNGERASYSAPKFARMQERTRSQMLEDIVANLANHAETGQIPKPYRRGSWRPIGEDPCMLRVTVSCCMRLYVAHSMYFALETLYSTLSLSVNLCICIKIVKMVHIWQHSPQNNAPTPRTTHHVANEQRNSRGILSHQQQCTASRKLFLHRKTPLV